MLDSPSILLRVEDGDKHINTVGRTIDGRDESIVSPRLSKRVDFNGSGKISKMKPTTIQVALKENDDIQSFTFSRAWTAPRTVLQLTTGLFALTIVPFLIADAALAADNISIRYPSCAI